MKDGAEELDMVINVGMIKSGDWDYVRRDIEAVVRAAGKAAIVKVILETCLLTDEEKRRRAGSAGRRARHLLRLLPDFLPAEPGQRTLS